MPQTLGRTKSTNPRTDLDVAGSSSKTNRSTDAGEIKINGGERDSPSFSCSPDRSPPPLVLFRRRRKRQWMNGGDGGSRCLWDGRGCYGLQPARLDGPSPFEKLFSMFSPRLEVQISPENLAVVNGLAYSLHDLTRYKHDSTRQVTGPARLEAWVGPCLALIGSLLGGHDMIHLARPDQARW
jgi:hypothetical protein